MDKTKNKLYLTLFTACLFGFIWLFYNLLAIKNKTIGLTTCYIKNITGFPCPSCGSTRSVLSIIKGDFIESLWINPLGIIVFLIMIISPIWIIIDLFRNNDSLFKCYKKIELYLKKPQLYLPLVALIILNWIWNIYKDL